MKRYRVARIASDHLPRRASSKAGCQSRSRKHAQRYSTSKRKALCGTRDSTGGLKTLTNAFSGSKRKLLEIRDGFAGKTERRDLVADIDNLRLVACDDGWTQNN